MSAGNAQTVIGSTHGGRTTVTTGDVINRQGNLRIGGGGCVGYRDGACCLKFHHGWCATNIVPTNKGLCPPRYEASGALCYLYSDKRHKVAR